MKVSILVLLVCVSGCMGLSIPEVETEVHHDKFALSSHKYSNISHPSDGRLKLDSKNVWCGFILWAILPIPAKLPVCESYEEVSYTEDQPTEITEVRVRHFLYGCGPGIWLKSIWNEDGKFCGRIQD